MFLLGFRRKLTALALCKSIESAIQWFQIHHRITFVTIQNATVYLSGARVSIFSTLVPRLKYGLMIVEKQFHFYLFIYPRELSQNVSPKEQSFLRPTKYCDPGMYPHLKILNSQRI